MLRPAWRSRAHLERRLERHLGSTTRSLPEQACCSKTRYRLRLGRVHIRRPALPQQPRAGEAERDDNDRAGQHGRYLAGVQDAEPKATGPTVWPMKKKNECNDSAVARASTDSSLANTCSEPCSI